MSEWLTKVINENQAIGKAKGIKKGQQKGIEIGEFDVYVKLVTKNLLSLKDAAEQTGMTENDFFRKAVLLRSALSFREAAPCFVLMRENGEYTPNDDELEHIEAVLKMLNVTDKDFLFETGFNIQAETKEIRKMSEWLARVQNKNQAIGEAKGIEKGLQKGIEIGEFDAFVKLVRKNLLSVKDAAEQADMTETEFCRKAGLPVKQ